MAQLPTTLKERISPIWTAAARQFELGKQWLIPRRQQAAFISAGAAVVLLLLIFSGVTAAVAAVAAWIALMRHFAQTDADRQRRITESYSKAVEQLANDKIEVRLGGIYTLERISRESPDDYWTIMETLTAFVRERARWKEPDADASQTAAHPSPPTDIAAAIVVIGRRRETERKRERREGWDLDLRDADLRGADLEGVHLEEAYLWGAHLEGAHLLGAYLQGARLQGTYLKDANLAGARLERADLTRAHLNGVKFEDTYLEGANLRGAHLEGVDLRGTTGIPVGLRFAYGDPWTCLPNEIPRPLGWPPLDDAPF
jgi:hypothetical protein